MAEDNKANSQEKNPSAGKVQAGVPVAEAGLIPDYLKHLPVKVDVLLGSVKLSVEELLSCGPGSVIDIGKKASEPFDLYVNETLVAKGEVVMMHDRLGLKIVEVVDKPPLPG